jgi:hypothetical protein
LEGNLWACHRAASTSAHFDSRHNLLVVLKGSKTVTLWSPAETKRLQPGSSLHAAASAGVADLVARAQHAASHGTARGAAGNGGRAEWAMGGASDAACGACAGQHRGHTCAKRTAKGTADGQAGAAAHVVAWPTHSLLGASDGAGVAVQVAAGDAIFIPEGWWHQVRQALC